MALFLLASYVYKAIKKKRDQEKGLGEPPVMGGESAKNPWGMDDLIQKFEESYGTTNPIEEQIVEKPELAMVDDSLDDNYSGHIENPYSVSESNFNSPEPALKEETKKAVNTKFRPSAYDDDNEVEPEYDIREMIISKAILDRPEY